MKYCIYFSNDRQTVLFQDFEIDSLLDMYKGIALAIYDHRRYSALDLTKIETITRAKIHSNDKFFEFKDIKSVIDFLTGYKETLNVDSRPIIEVCQQIDKKE